MQLLPVTCFGFFEFIGTTELLVVLFVALLVFGPRKLPELGRSLGRALNQVREASDDFKRTWESEALPEGEARSPRTLPAASAQGVEGVSVGASGESAQRVGLEAAVGLVGPALEAQSVEADA